MPEATDPDGDSLTYSLSGEDAARFTLDSGAGELHTGNDSPNFTTRGNFLLTVVVSDGKSGLDGVDTSPVDFLNVTIRVVDNANSEFTTPSGTVPEDAEDTDAIGMVHITDLDGDTDFTYELTADSDHPFEIANKQISLTTDGTLDFEGRNSYELTLRVHDGKDEDGEPDLSWDDEIQVTINVTNADEDGEVSLSSHHPEVGMKITATLTDPDGVNLEGENLINWKLDKVIDPMFGTGTVIATSDSTSQTFEYTPVSDDVGKYLRFQATYLDGFAKTNETIYAAATGNAVRAGPPTNRAPTFTESAPSTRSVPEDIAAGSDVGMPVAATDHEGDTLTYSHFEYGSDKFEIDTGTGHISLLSDVSLDYESDQTHCVRVEIRDSKDSNGNADTARDKSRLVTINVTNVEEPGIVELTPDNAEVGSELTGQLSDPDGSVANLTWQWQTADSAGAATWTDITDATSISYIPAPADIGMYLRAQASYDDGEGTGKEASGTTGTAVTRSDNEPPEFE